MSLSTELDSSLQYKVNFVAEFIIDGISTYFSKHQPDSGLVIPDANVGMLKQVQVNAANIDLRRVTTAIPSTTLQIVDTGDYTFTNYMGSDLSGLINREVKIYVGLNTNDGFDFADYVLQNNYFVKNIDFKIDTYKVSCKGTPDRMAKRIMTIQGNVETSINDTDTSIDVTTTQDIFPATGIIKVKDELMVYTGKSSTA